MSDNYITIVTGDEIEIEFFGEKNAVVELIGIGPAGPTGIKGDKGDPGSKGDQGPKGEDGVITPELVALRDQTITARNDAQGYSGSAAASAVDTDNDRIAAEAAKTASQTARDQAVTAASTATSASGDAIAARNAAQLAEVNAAASEQAAEEASDEAALSAASADASADAAAISYQQTLDAINNFGPQSFVNKNNNGSDFADPAAVRANIGAAEALETVSQAEAQAGTSTTPRYWTAQRVRQATADKAPVNNPAFTGTVTVPTPLTNDTSNQAANTSWVRDQIAKLVGDGVPEALDTLKELAQALGDDPNFAATVTAQLGNKSDVGHLHTVAQVTGLQTTLNQKANLNNPNFTGTVSVPTMAASDGSAAAANTNWVRSYVTSRGYVTSVHTHVIADITGLQAALDAKAALASPALTGTPTVPTAAPGTNTTQIASTAFAMLAAANAASGMASSNHTHVIGDITNLQTTLDLKAPLDSPVLTGTPQGPTATAGTATNQLATTKFAQDGLDLKFDKAGGVLTGKATFAASTSDTSSLNIPHGVTPSNTVNGDVWTTSSGIYAKINGSTMNLSPPQVTQAVAEAGTSTTINNWTAQRVRQAIVAAPVGTATQTALDAKQNSLGFTPLQQGGGANQGTNKLYIGWGTGSTLLLQVDATDFGNTWPINVNGSAAKIGGYAPADLPVSTPVQTALNGKANLVNGDVVIGSAGTKVQSDGNVFFSGGMQTNYGTALSTALDDRLKKSGGSLTGSVSSVGFTFGSNAASAINDLSKHLNLYGNNEYGLSVTNGYLNFISGSAFQWANGTTVRMTLSNVGDLTATGNITAYSDKRLKKNIKTIKGALDMVDQMRGVRFEMNGRAGIGVIAQEFQKVAPELVHEAEDKRKTLSVAYGNSVGILIEAIKELRGELAQARKEIEKLKGRK